MKKILTLLNMVTVITFLMLLGLAGFIFATGRMDKEKAQTILDLVRHPGTPTGLRNNVYAQIDPTFAATATASAPASETASTATRSEEGMADAGDPASASERLEYTRQAVEKERLRLERNAQDLRHRQELLDQEQAGIQASLQKIDEKQKAYDAQTKAAAAASKTEAFARALDLYNSLKPKQVKDLFMSLTPETVASFITAMETDRAAKIIAEFKSPEEKTFISSVMDAIRNAAPAAGTANATQPSDTASSSAAASAAK